MSSSSEERVSSLNKAPSLSSLPVHISLSADFSSLPNLYDSLDTEEYEVTEDDSKIRKENGTDEDEYFKPIKKLRMIEMRHEIAPSPPKPITSFLIRDILNHKSPTPRRHYLPNEGNIVRTSDLDSEASTATAGSRRGPRSAGCRGKTRSAGSRRMPRSAGSRRMPRSAGSRRMPRSAGSRRMSRSTGSRQMPRSAGSRRRPRSAEYDSRLDHFGRLSFGSPATMPLNASPLHALVDMTNTGFEELDADDRTLAKRNIKWLQRSSRTSSSEGEIIDVL